MEEKYISNEISISASPDKVWAVLTKPEFTKIYMFGCETVTDWKVGSNLLWKGEWEGKEMVFVKGTILNLIPNKSLVYTVFDPNNATLKDVPENYLTVSYELTEGNGHTKLSVRQGDYNRVGQGEKRYNESYNGGEGWNPILVQIKKISEQNE
jgi:uncharacterized protein YndB with AHSA1/START domain